MRKSLKELPMRYVTQLNFIIIFVYILLLAAVVSVS